MDDPGATRCRTTCTSIPRERQWGDGALGTGTHVDLDPLKNAEMDGPVYGRIPARQSVADGRYTDNLMVVMVF
ncbi:MAG: spore coat protein U domain-containing protein [Acidobacteria bacterium]|nr:spore coat protein U domain-containing protein [Acidobacteriota bacterium]